MYHALHTIQVSRATVPGRFDYQACGRHPALIFTLLQMEKITNKINVVLCWSKLKTSRWDHKLWSLRSQNKWETGSFSYRLLLNLFSIYNQRCYPLLGITKNAILPLLNSLDQQAVLLFSCFKQTWATKMRLFLCISHLIYALNPLQTCI